MRKIIFGSWFFISTFSFSLGCTLDLSGCGNDPLPFPKIPGPSRKDKIAIVGAGPAGIHMALSLKQKGFCNFKIFEASDRIGGKSRTLQHRGAPHDMGTVYLQPDYVPNVIALAEHYNYGTRVDLAAPSVWTEPIPNPNSLDQTVPHSFNTYVIFETIVYLTPILGYIPSPMEAGALLGQGIQNYNNLHNCLFGTYEGELMPEPADATLERIRGTAQEFLERECLLILRPLFLASTTIQGYGQLNEISAFYLLMWNTPNLMLALLARLGGAESIGVFLFDNGFQGLWEKIAITERFPIDFQSEVIKLQRVGQKFKITSSNGPSHSKTAKTETFDFVMWSPELSQSLDIIEASPEERALFQTAKVEFFTTTLLDELGSFRGESPVDFFMRNVESTEPHDVWAQRDSYSTVRKIEGADYKNGLTVTGNDNSPKRSMVSYQMGPQKPTTLDLDAELNKHFNTLGGKTNKICRRTWRYFPRYTPQEIRDGIIWKILKNQGNRKMWFIGSSVIFESAKSVIEYNKLLFRIME